MKKIVFLLLGLFLLLPAYAQRTNTRDYVYVSFEPDHADWTYHCGDSVRITMAVRLHNVAQPGALIEYEWGPDQRKAPMKGHAINNVTGVVTIRLAGSKEPGFRTLRAKATIDGKEYSNIIKLAFDPDSLKPTAVMPADFMDYWQQRVAKMREIPLEPLFTRKPEYDTPYCDTYEVCFSNMSKTNKMYGMLAVPKGVNPTDTVATKRYPAVILWPGAGVKQHFGDVTFFPEKGVITLEMGIHGISVSMPKQHYDDLAAGALNNYPNIVTADRNRYYYNKVYVGAAKTVDLLCSLPCVDTTRIAAYGGSQGGALSIVTAALDKRIKAIGVAYPALCEIAGYYRGRAEGWPHLFCSNKADTAKVNMADYYDVVNFAQYVNCETLFFLGYNDVTCCPTSTYTAYNVIPAEKRLITLQECGHWMYPEFHQMRREWLVEQLAKPVVETTQPQSKTTKKKSGK